MYLNNGVDWAGLLTESAVNTLCHVDVIACSTSTSICSFFSFNCNGLIKRSNSLWRHTITVPNYS